jgi:hypothetical protein
MKYMISWFERPQGSPMEYENAKYRSTSTSPPDDCPIFHVLRDHGGL